MANSRKEDEKDLPKSLTARFKQHIHSVAAGPKGLASIANEFRYALTDIRHKVVEEATYGRAVTPHWREPQNAPQAPGGIHGKTDTPDDKDAGPGIHGKTDTPSPAGDGGIHGKMDAPKPDAPLPGEGGVHGKDAQAEPKGLGMSYAELAAGWDQACAGRQGAGKEREPARQQEPAIER